MEAAREGAEMGKTQNLKGGLRVVREFLNATSTMTLMVVVAATTLVACEPDEVVWEACVNYTGLDTDGDGADDGCDPCPNDATNSCVEQAVADGDADGDSDGDGDGDSDSDADGDGDGDSNTCGDYDNPSALSQCGSWDEWAGFPWAPAHNEAGWRGFTLDDGHCYCPPEDSEDVAFQVEGGCWEFIAAASCGDFLRTFGSEANYASQRGLPAPIRGCVPICWIVPQPPL